MSMKSVLIQARRLLIFSFLFVVGMKAGAEQVACLNQDAGICRLVSPTVALSVTATENDADVQYFAPSVDGFTLRAHTKVRSDLEAKLVSGALSEADAAVIFSEILANPYVAYKLPPSSQALNQEVGFAPDVQLSPQDQIEVLRAHLQMSLSVSAVTSRYLSDGLGLRVIEPIRPANPTESVNQSVNQDDPNMTPTPQPEPTPAAQPQDAQGPAPEPMPEVLPAPLPAPIQTNPPTERITEAQALDQTQS